MNLPELESSDGLPHRGQSGQYLPNAEMAQIIVESIHQSVQKGSATANESSNVKGNSLATFKGEKVLQNSAKSLPGNLFPNATKGLKEGERPRHIYLSTFKQVNKSVLLSNSADSLSGNSGVPAHQYSSDVILAQPQSYCESNHDLHYDSSDILNNPNHFLLRVNDSYSSEDNLSQPRGSLQDFVSSDGLSHSQFSNLETNNFSTSSEVSSLQGCGSPDSPPQAISPTGEFRNLLEKIQQLPNQKDGSKYLETKLYDLSSDEYRSREIRLSISKKPKERENFSRIDESERGDDSEETEKCTLLTELPQSASKPKSRKLSVIRPNKLLNRENFLSRSKTFYMPFCNGSFNSKKSSTSAPVTPISNFPSPGTLSLNFLSNPNKFGSKKSLESKADGRLLLQDGEHESNDELFWAFESSIENLWKNKTNRIIVNFFLYTHHANYLT